MGNIYHFPSPSLQVVVDGPKKAHLDIIYSDKEYALIEGCVPLPLAADFFQRLNKKKERWRPSMLVCATVLLVGFWLDPNPIEQLADADALPETLGPIAFSVSIEAPETELLNGAICRTHRSLRAVTHQSSLPRCTYLFKEAMAPLASIPGQK